MKKQKMKMKAKEKLLEKFLFESLQNVSLVVGERIADALLSPTPHIKSL